MDRINVFRMISNIGGLDPADMILQYFNQIMYLYNLYDPSSKLLDISKGHNSISFRIEYPYQINGTDIGMLIDQINNQLHLVNTFKSICLLFKAGLNLLTTNKGVIRICRTLLTQKNFSKYSR